MFGSSNSFCFEYLVVSISVHIYSSRHEYNFVPLFKVSRKTLNYIRSLVREHMINEDMYFALLDDKEMSLNNQIDVSIIRLGSVYSSINIAILFETNNVTIDEVTCQFVEALESRRAHRISWPSHITHKKVWYESIDSFPNCCGAIETTHIKMHTYKCESKVDIWRDMKNHNSNKYLQVIVDKQCNFLMRFLGTQGVLPRTRWF